MMHYVEKRGEGYYFIKSRVSLESVIGEFLRGESPESIVQSFPSLTLEQVYGGITFYLANRSEIDRYLQQSSAIGEEVARAARKAHPLLYQKLDATKKTTV
ncbi:MAG: DUF433 domain-containing protein [Acidobacteria bacterium]|nr:DUF433 domain-containing protein [Acidobacteriota bacterium]MBV9147131.1 DUF433 domain-containing protein [Acidobacteriota bacterium]MBV9437682.1 DUF433 domain-containing protein [Acidobacteriota bacterium]